MHKKRLAILAALVTLVVILGVGQTAYAADRTPTRTTPLNLTALSQRTDHLNDEGWLWEPGENGGVLTLQNCYLKGDHYGHGLIFGRGDIILQLKGDNIVETTSDYFQPLIFTDSPDDEVTWTVRDASGDGKLTLKMPDSTKQYLPYGFSGKKVIIESGEIHAEMGLARPWTFEMSGGSVTVEKGTGVNAAIEAMMGNAILTGGKIRATNVACGISAPYKNKELIIDGADIEIAATKVAIDSDTIYYKSGKLNITGAARAAYSPILTTIPGTGTTKDGKTNQPYDASKNNQYTSFQAEHTHKAQAGVWGSSEEAHWGICECGETLESEPHQFTQQHDADAHWQSCVCGKTKDAEAHTYGAWVETKAATQTEAGMKTRACTTCGYQQSEELAMLPSPPAPKTGDATPLAAYALTLALSGAALLLLLRRRQARGAEK